LIGNPQYGNDWHQPSGWIYNLLPYMEAQALHDIELGKSGQDRIEAADQLVATTFSFVYCPSRRAPILVNNTSTSEHQAQTDYAGNGGEQFWGFVTTAGGSNSSSMTGPANYAEGTISPGKAGWNDAATRSCGVFYGASQTRIADIRDGTTNTYLMGEKHLSTPNYNTGGGDAGDDQSMYTGYQDDVIRWTGTGSDTSYAPHQDAETASVMIFGSAHSSWFNVAMCDGSVRLVTYSINLETHRCLGNCRDGKPVDTRNL
jgi:prepilin-type processing-associated H-X9-DG protein